MQRTISITSTTRKIKMKKTKKKKRMRKIKRTRRIIKIMRMRAMRISIVYMLKLRKYIEEGRGNLIILIIVIKSMK
jgi:hypothetical protein